MKWNKSKDLLALIVGHGKSLDGSWDPGCTYGKESEAALMLPIVQCAAKWLRKSGVKVLTDADTKNDKNMKASVAMANQKGADLYISVHCDYSAAASGIMFYYGDNTDKKCGDTIVGYLAKALGLKNKGGKKDLAKFEINSPKASSIILETGGIKSDLKTLQDEQRYGKALAKAICKYIGVQIYVSKRTKLMRKMAELLAYMNSHNFKYLNNYKKCGMSWAEAKKTHRSNCATAVSWSAQEIGLLKPGQIFWIAGTTIECRGSGCKTRVKKKFTIKHPKKVASKVTLKAGYIVGYSPYHTQIFVKKNKAGKPMWYSYGKHDPKKKQPRRKASYDKKKIMTVMIPK